MKNSESKKSFKGRHVQLPSSVHRYLTAPEVAALLRKELRTIYNMVSQKRIPFRRAGRELLFDPQEIDEWTKAGAGRM